MKSYKCWEIGKKIWILLNNNKLFGLSKRLTMIEWNHLQIQLQFTYSNEILKMSCICKLLIQVFFFFKYLQSVLLTLFYIFWSLEGFKTWKLNSKNTFCSSNGTTLNLCINFFFTKFWFIFFFMAAVAIFQ